MPHDDPYVPGLKPWRTTLREAEAKFPGLTMPASAWHANEIIRRLDRLIELQERQGPPNGGDPENELRAIFGEPPLPGRGQ